MKTFLLDGSNFSDIEGFYDEIDKLLTKNLQWKTGHNLNAFNDLLRGGFGVHEYGEPITIRWMNYVVDYFAIISHLCRNLTFRL